MKNTFLTLTLFIHLTSSVFAADPLWITVYRDDSSDIALREGYLKIEKGLAFAIMRSRDLSVGNYPHRDSEKQIGFSLSQCDSTAVEVTTIDGVTTERFFVDSHHPVRRSVAKICEWAGR